MPHRHARRRTRSRGPDLRRYEPGGRLPIGEGAHPTLPFDGPAVSGEPAEATTPTFHAGSSAIDRPIGARRERSRDLFLVRTPRTSGTSPKRRSNRRATLNHPLAPRRWRTPTAAPPSSPPTPAADSRHYISGSPRHPREGGTIRVSDGTPGDDVPDTEEHHRRRTP
jgi:hypothetical protein